MAVADCCSDRTFSVLVSSSGVLSVVIVSSVIFVDDSVSVSGSVGSLAEMGGGRRSVAG